MKRLLLLACVTGALLWGSEPQKTVTVGIVTDGPAPVYATLAAAVTEELSLLGAGEFEVKVRDTLEGHWNVASVESAFKRLETDSKTDIVLALGVVSGAVAADAKALPKPTFAPVVFRSGGDLAKVRNFNYLDAGITFKAALERFHAACGFSDLTLLLDAAHAELLRQEGADLVRTAAASGIRLTLVTDDGSGAIADRIPEHCDAVMLGLLPRMNDGARQDLIDTLMRRSLPSFSLDSRITPETGILMGIRNTDDTERRARRTALNILETIRGARAEDQPVRFALEAPLTLNMATARAIGFAPSFALMSDALLLHELPARPDNRLSLAEAAREALRANLSIIAATLESAAGAAAAKEVRSVLLPQLSAGLAHSRYNADNVYVANGFYAKNSTGGSLRLEQLLFSEKSLAQIEIAEKRHDVLKAQQHLLELDVVERAASAFLGLLDARERLTIRKEQLSLVEANLKLARARVETGVSDRSDLYHWESLLASERQQLLGAEAEVRNRSDLLNFILGRPVAAAVNPLPVTLDDPELLISRREVRGLVTNEAQLQRLESFFTEEALSRAPELSILEAQGAAEARQLASERRAYWSPDVAAYGEATRVFDESRAPTSSFSLEDKTNWEAGVALSLPLYEGGARGDRIDRSRLRLEALQTREHETREELSRRIRSDLHAMRASHPAIALSAAAEEAARKSYELIRENYALGSRPMTDLLMAQSTRLNARQAAVDARYRFLGDLIALQRDTSRFDFLLDAAEKRALVRCLLERVGSGETTPNGE